MDLASALWLFSKRVSFAYTRRGLVYAIFGGKPEQTSVNIVRKQLHFNPLLLSRELRLTLLIVLGCG